METGAANQNLNHPAGTDLKTLKDKFGCETRLPPRGGAAAPRAGFPPGPRRLRRPRDPRCCGPARVGGGSGGRAGARRGASRDGV